MRIDLTDQERDFAIRYAARLEKNAERWRFWRWSGLFGLTVGVCLLFAAEYIGQKLCAVAVPDQVINQQVTPTPDLNAGAIRLLSSHIESKTVALRAEFRLILKAMIVAGIGLALFAQTMSDWRRDERDKLVAKILRCLATAKGNASGGR